MKNSTLLRRGAVALLVSVLVVSAGTATVLADTGPSDTGAANVHSEHTGEGESDVTIDGLDLTLEDIRITSDGLPEMRIEERTYSVAERTITLDGLTMTINDTEIGLNELSVTIEESTVSIKNVGIGNG